MDARVKVTAGPANGRTRLPAHDEELRNGAGTGLVYYLDVFRGRLA